VIDALLVCLSEDGDEFVRFAAAEALESMGPTVASPEVIDTLLGRFRVETHKAVQAAIAVTLGELGSGAERPEILEHLLAWRCNTTVFVAEAVRALGRLGPVPAVIDIMIAGLDNDFHNDFTSVREADEILARMMLQGIRIRRRDGQRQICHVNSLVDCKSDCSGRATVSAAGPLSGESTGLENRPATPPPCEGCALLPESSRSG